MRRAFEVFWRALYPLLLYLLAGSAVEVTFERMNLSIGLGQGVLVTGVAAAIVAIPLGILYRNAAQYVKRPRQCEMVSLLWIIILGVSSCLFLNRVIAWTGLTSRAYEEASALLYNPPLLLQVIAMGCVIPVTEELVFRGLGYFPMRWELPVWKASVLSAVLFGLFHGNIVQGVYATALGLLLAFVYEVYGSLWAPVGFHMAANLCSIAMTRWYPQESTVSPVCVVLTGVLSGVFMIYGMYKIREDGKEHETIINCNPLL